jgi:hypothetical protein
LPDTKFGDLTSAAGNWTLMALVAGLSIEQRTEPIGDGMELLKIGLVQLVRAIVYDCVAQVVEAGLRLRLVRNGFGMRCGCCRDCARIRRTSGENEAEAKQSNAHKGLHGSLLIPNKSMPVFGARQSDFYDFDSVPWRHNNIYKIHQLRNLIDLVSRQRTMSARA